MVYGKFCLRLYGDTDDISKLKCLRCMRKYFVNTANSNLKDCEIDYTSDDVSDATNLKWRSLSFNLENAFLSSELPALILPSKSDTLTVTMLCYQVNEAKDKCLQCKTNLCPSYSAVDWATLASAASQYPQKAFLFRKTFNFAESELTYSLSSPGVSDCKPCKDENVFPKDAITYNISTSKYYLCLYNPDLSLFATGTAELVLTFTIAATNQSSWPMGYLSADTASYLSACYFRVDLLAVKTKFNVQKDLPFRPPMIDNCVDGWDNSKLPLTGSQRMYLTCYQCASNNSLIYSFYVGKVIDNRTGGATT